MAGWLLALGILAGADAATTCYALHTGIGVERNPLLGPAPGCGRVIAIKAAAVGGTWGAARLLQRHGHPTAARWSIGIVVSINGVAVGWNLTQLGRRE